ncbi:MAG: hypothetical protein ACREFZ_07720 [Acetobacteraceae bacterium]
MREGIDADKTVRMSGSVRPGKPRRGPEPSGHLLLWSGLAGVIVIVAAAYFIFLTPRVVPIKVANAREILAARPAKLLVFRFRPDPDVIVLDFPTLHQQGEMLNRVAALVEKASAPRDRVLTESQLAAVIKASGATPDTYYYGHDYRAADLVRFFHLMQQDHVAANPEERWLRALLGQLHWFRAGAVGAIITLPGPGAAPGLDASGRATIFEHESSHGAYFTIPAYDAYAHRFFYHVLTTPERELFRRFLAGEGYDTAITDLVINETQAYLMFTPDPRFFSAALVGMYPQVLQALRETFWRNIPVPWLKRSVPDPVVTKPQPRPATVGG